MASFYIDGLDRLTVDIAQLSQISDEDILHTCILPAAEKLVQFFKDSASSLMGVRTGSLVNSIKVTGKSTGPPAWALVGPDQGQHPHASHGKRKPRAQGGGGGHYAGTNAEIGWILEYGTSRIPGRHWMEQALQEHEAEVVETMEAGWSELIDRYFGT